MCTVHHRIIVRSPTFWCLRRICMCPCARKSMGRFMRKNERNWEDAEMVDYHIQASCPVFCSWHKKKTACLVQGFVRFWYPLFVDFPTIGLTTSWRIFLFFSYSPKLTKPGLFPLWIFLFVESPFWYPQGCRFAGKANCEISLYRGLWHPGRIGVIYWGLRLRGTPKNKNKMVDLALWKL